MPLIVRVAPVPETVPALVVPSPQSIVAANDVPWRVRRDGRPWPPCRSSRWPAAAVIGAVLSVGAA